jgi:hypothetical protein
MCHAVASAARCFSDPHVKAPLVVKHASIANPAIAIYTAEMGIKLFALHMRVANREQRLGERQMTSTLETNGTP